MKKTLFYNLMDFKALKPFQTMSEKVLVDFEPLN